MNPNGLFHALLYKVPRINYADTWLLEKNVLELGIVMRTHRVEGMFE